MYAEWHDRTRLKFVIQSRRAGEVGSITSSYVLFPECVFLERACGGNVFFIKGGNYVVAEERQEIRVAEKRRFSVSFHAQVDSLYVIRLRTEVLSTVYMNAHDENAEDREIQIYDAC